MKKLLLIFTLFISSLCSAQIKGKYESDSVFVYENYLENKYDSFKVSSLIEFYSKNDSAFISIKSKYASSLLYTETLLGSDYLSGFLMYTFNAKDLKNNENILLSIQFVEQSKKLSAVGILDKKGRFTAFIIKELKPKNSL